MPVRRSIRSSAEETTMRPRGGRGDSGPMDAMTTQHDELRTRPRLGRYRIDTGRSTVAFRSRHLFGLATVRGTFTIRTGVVDVAEPLAESAVHVDIDAASFHTGNDHRDGDVRSARFLDADRHPVLTFRTEAVDATTLTGVLGVRDVQRPVTVPVELADVSPGAFTVRATARIDRTAFGITAARGLAGRFVDLTMEVRCVRT
jgi:polyisoprenoid-binding protein YceI